MIVENPLSHGVYVAGHGVVQPGKTLNVKKDDPVVQSHLRTGSLRERNGDDEPNQQTSERELPPEPVPEDPAPAVTEVDTGTPGEEPAGDEPGTDTKEENNAA